MQPLLCTRSFFESTFPVHSYCSIQTNNYTCAEGFAARFYLIFLSVVFSIFLSFLHFFKNMNYYLLLNFFHFYCVCKTKCHWRYLFPLLTGWGLTIPGDWDSQADILQQTKLPIISSNECKRNYKDISIPITSSMICTGHDLTSTISTCNTDSGGPIICKNNLNGKWYLQGVVSFGAGGCRPGYYSVNAKVSKFTTWINSYIY